MTTTTPTRQAGTRARALLGSRRRLALALTALVLLAGALAAYAQVSGSGGGGTPAGAGGLTITSSPVGPLTPQINPSDVTPVTVTVANGFSSARAVGAISGTVAPTPGCPSTWFTVAPIAAPGQVGPGVHTYASSVILNNNDRDQTACTGHVQTITWTSSGS